MARLIFATLLAVSCSCVFAQEKSGTVVQGSAGWGHFSTGDKSEGRTLWESGTEPWNPKQKSSLGEKKFEKSLDMNIRDANLGNGAFGTGGKNPGYGYKQTREFLGLKNPWFGKKVYEANKASLWSKTDVANANKKFAVDAADTREFYQADKKAAERSEPVPTRSTKMEAKYQGFLDKTMSKKDLTVEEVRALLNKNR